MVGEVQKSGGAKLEIKTDPMPLHDTDKIEQVLNTIKTIGAALVEDGQQPKKSDRFHHPDCQMTAKQRFSVLGGGRKVGMKDQHGHDLLYSFELTGTVASVQTSVGLPVDFFTKRCVDRLNPDFVEPILGYRLRKLRQYLQPPNSVAGYKELGWMFHSLMCHDYDVFPMMPPTHREDFVTKDVHFVLPRIMMDGKGTKDICSKVMRPGWDKFTDESACPKLLEKTTAGKFIPCFWVDHSLGFVLELRADGVQINSVIKSFMEKPNVGITVAIEDLQFVVNRVWTVCAPATVEEAVANSKKYKMLSTHAPKYSLLELRP